MNNWVKFEHDGIVEQAMTDNLTYFYVQVQNAHAVNMAESLKDLMDVQLNLR